MCMMFFILRVLRTRCPSAHTLGCRTLTILNPTGNILAGICINNDETKKRWGNLREQMEGGWVDLGEQMLWIQMCPWTHREHVKAAANESLGEGTRSWSGWRGVLRARLVPGVATPGNDCGDSISHARFAKRGNTFLSFREKCTTDTSNVARSS